MQGFSTAIVEWGSPIELEFNSSPGWHIAQVIYNDEDITEQVINTEPQSIGTVSITGINSEAFAQFSKVVRFYPSYVCMLINENGDRIECTFGELSPDGTTILSVEEYIASGDLDDYPGISSDTSIEYGVQVGDWSTAVPGTTYSFRVYYHHMLRDA